MIELALDIILVLVVAEATLLVVYFRRSGRGIAPRRLLPNLAAGFFLMLAVRIALADGAAALLPVCLLAALIAHVFDLAGRWNAP